VQNEELPWERKERIKKLEDEEGKDLPFPVYLLGSAIIAIAAVILILLSLTHRIAFMKM
jgi:hypothetical protein